MSWARLFEYAASSMYPSSLIRLSAPDIIFSLAPLAKSFFLIQKNLQPAWKGYSGNSLQPLP
jgi:hypothetical protein